MKPTDSVGLAFTGATPVVLDPSKTALHQLRCFASGTAALEQAQARALRNEPGYAACTREADQATAQANVGAPT